jgi:Rap1a immunity proteins
MCERAKPMAQAYTAGLWDGSVRSAFVLETTFRGIAHDVAVNFGLERLGGFCAPHGVTVAQVTDALSVYLRNTPEKRQTHAALLFSDAMKKAWPCKKE